MTDCWWRALVDRHERALWALLDRLLGRGMQRSEASGQMIAASSAETGMKASDMTPNRWQLVRRAVQQESVPTAAAAPRTGWDALLTARDANGRKWLGGLIASTPKLSFRQAFTKVRALQIFRRETSTVHPLPSVPLTASAKGCCRRSWIGLQTRFSKTESLEPASHSSKIEPWRLADDARESKVVPDHSAAGMDGRSNPQGPSAAAADERRAAFGKDGWRGTQYLGQLVDGVYEDQKSLNIRVRIRLLPEVVQLVEKLWSACKPVQGRILVQGYMNFHLSCYHYIATKESESVDLVEAWDIAIQDWVSDTEELFDVNNRRELDFGLFRESVFELIDLYTPTTDQVQYIAYMKLLVKATTTHKDGGIQLRYTWPKPRRNGKAAATILSSLRQDSDNADRESHERRLNTLFLEWTKGMRAYASQTQDEDEGGDALTLRGFHVSCGVLLGVQDSTTGDAFHRLLDAFRRLNVSGTGQISLADLHGAVLDNMSSKWWPNKSTKNLLQVATRRVSAANALAHNGTLHPDDLTSAAGVHDKHKAPIRSNSSMKRIASVVSTSTAKVKHNKDNPRVRSTKYM